MKVTIDKKGKSKGWLFCTNVPDGIDKWVALALAVQKTGEMEIMLSMPMLRYANFSDMTCKKLNVFAGSCRFIELKGAVFQNCTFTKCDFTSAKFSGATFKKCKFKGCKFDGVDLSSASFVNCVLEEK